MPILSPNSRSEMENETRNPADVTAALRMSSKGKLVYHRDPRAPLDTQSWRDTMPGGSSDDEGPDGVDENVPGISDNQEPEPFFKYVPMPEAEPEITVDPKKAEFVTKSLTRMESERKAKLMAKERQNCTKFSNHSRELGRKAEEEIFRRLEALTLERKREDEELQKRFQEWKMKVDREIENSLLQEIQLQTKRKELLAAQIRQVEETSKMKQLKNKQLGKVAEKLQVLHEARSLLPEADHIISKHLDVAAVAGNMARLSEEDSPDAIRKLIDVTENDINNISIAMRDVESAKIAADELKKLEEEAKAKENAERKAREEEEKRVAAAKLAEEQARISVPDPPQVQPKTEAPPVATMSSEGVSVKNKTRNEQLKAFKQEIKMKVKPLVEDRSTFRFLCQKAVNTPVNAISPTSSVHLADKLQKLSKLLRGEHVEVSGQTLSASSHPLGIDYCMLLLAKKFVCQGEDVISSKPETAFSMAAVIVSLWNEFPTFGNLFLARLYEICPYLIPYVPPHPAECSKEDYLALGYKYDEEGKVEEQIKFIKRMTGIARLYAAITVSQLPKGKTGNNHPHGLGNVWSWLSSTLNTKPMNDVTATLIYDVLEVTGFEMFRKFGSAFKKLLEVLSRNYFPLIKEVTKDGCGGPVMRLETFLQKAISSGTIMQPSAVLKPGFLI